MAAASHLHDYELFLQSIDYSVSKLVIMLKDLKECSAELEICQFWAFIFVHNEP